MMKSTIVWLLVMSVWLLAPTNAWARFYAGERMGVAEGINIIYLRACQKHCNVRRIDDCVRECVEQYFEVIGENVDDPELNACRQAGGVLRHRVDGCASSLAALLDADDQEDVTFLLDKMYDVTRMCSAHMLCDAPNEGR